MMNEQKKEQIMLAMTKNLAAKNMAFEHLYMLMGDKGYAHQDVQDFFKECGYPVSQGEFTEIYQEMTGALNKRKQQAADARKEEENKDIPKNLDEIMQKQNIVTNSNEDLLSKIKKPKGIEDYAPDSMGPSYTQEANDEEPPAEEVQLPSKGKFYSGTIANKEGKILIRPMTLKEEKVFTNERLLKTGQAIDIVFRSCIKTPGIDTTELLSSDRVFLLFYLRAISYGTEYTVETACNNPTCKTANKTQLKILDMEIKYPPEELEDPFSITLPSSKLKIIMRLARGKDEASMIKDSNINKMGQEGGDKIVERILSLVIDIEGIPRKDWKKKIENLIGKDISYIRQTMEVTDFGYSVHKIIECEGCNKELELNLTINENFFRSE